MLALAIKTSPRLSTASNSITSDSRDKSGMICTHCKKTGHDVATCFAKIGYPEWWETRPRREGERGAGGGRGPAPQQRRDGGRGTGGAGVVHHVAAAGHGVPAGIAGSSADMMHGGYPSPLSGEQWQKLMSLLGNDNPSNPGSSNSDRLMGKNSSVTWIFDTGATLHATGSHDCLVDCFEGPVCPVILPDGSTICHVPIREIARPR